MVNPFKRLVHRIKESFSTDPTASRWAILQFLFSACLFLIAVSLTGYTIYLSFVGGVLMCPPWWFFFIIGIAVFFGLLAGGLAIYWLFFVGSKDTSTKRLGNVDKALEQVDKTLGKMEKRMGGIEKSMKIRTKGKRGRY